MFRAVILAFGLTMLLLSALVPGQASAREEGPAFAVANQSFWDYYQKRGGLRTFGHPISRQFTLRAFQVQLFQRGVLQLMPDGHVATMNLLDPGMMPYTSFNYSAVPGPQRELIDAAPFPSDPDYARKAIDFVLANAPDQWQGLPVGFTRTFMATVRYEDAFPQGGGEPSLLPLLNLELWGLPTSLPARDPNNRNFVYQRFQRGIMHYDAANGVTQGLLLGDYFKAILTGEDLPPDVESQAAYSPYYRQYDPVTERGPLRATELAGTNLEEAFRPPLGDPRFGVVVAGPSADDPSYVAASLATLGAGSWYSFGAGRAKVRGRVDLVRPGADPTELAARARANPGATWLIGNEPNVPGQDDLQPAAYADFLWKVSTALKEADPTALLVGPNVLNWEVTCTNCSGYAKGRGWSEAFLTSYRERYGALPLDVWGIHAYSLDWDHLPLVDAASDQAQLNGAREWLNAKGLRLPLWLTEFGVIWGFDGIRWVQQNGQSLALPVGSFREDLVGGYLEGMLSWLSRSSAEGLVDRWFIYATAPPPEPYATRTAGIGLLEPGKLTLTPLGERFRALAAGATSFR